MSKNPSQSTLNSLDEADEDMRLPPRRIVHPSNRRKISRYFFNMLILLFVTLMIGLMIWGRQMVGR